MLCRRNGRVLVGGPEGVISFDPRNVGSEQEWRKRLFPKIGERVPFIKEETHASLSFYILVIIIIFFTVCLAFVFYYIKWSEKNSFKPLGVDVDPITGIVSVDELTVEKLKSVVEPNIGNADFTVEQMAREMGMSRSQLHKRMVTLTGYAPLEYLRRYRLERARQYLLESQLSVAEIAYTVGFNSPKLFSKYFKSIYGKLPSEIRPK